MFDLEKQIGEWRRGMMGGGMRSAKILDELETHLRSEFVSLGSSGMSDVAAFETAVARVGNPEELAAEFNKVNGGSFWPVTLVWVAFWFLSILWSWEAVSRHWSDGSLLVAHTVILLPGYLASYLINALALAYILYWRCGAMKNGRASALHGAMVKFNGVGIAFISVGFVLGVAYNIRATGRYWHWGISEVETLARLIWVVIFSRMLRSGLSQRVIALWFLAVDLAIGLALWSAIIAMYPGAVGRVKFLLSVMGAIYASQLVGLILGWLPMRERTVTAE